MPWRGEVEDGLGWGGLVPTAAEKREEAERVRLRARAADLYERLHSMSKTLEGSGRLDEDSSPDAYATVLDAMNFMRLCSRV